MAKKTKTKSVTSRFLQRNLRPSPESKRAKAYAALTPALHAQLRHEAETNTLNTASAFEVFAPMVRYLNDHPEANYAWSILSALRGPDTSVKIASDAFLRVSSVDEVKEATTGVIRWALGLNGAAGDFTYLVNKDSAARVKTRMKMLGVSGIDLTGLHFLTHAELAFSALGLKWNEVNK